MVPETEYTTAYVIDAPTVNALELVSIVKE